MYFKQPCSFQVHLSAQVVTCGYGDPADFQNSFPAPEFTGLINLLVFGCIFSSVQLPESTTGGLATSSVSGRCVKLPFRNAEDNEDTE